jgi:hypothetical protein
LPNLKVLSTFVRNNNIFARSFLEKLCRIPGTYFLAQLFIIISSKMSLMSWVLDDEKYQIVMASLLVSLVVSVAVVLYGNRVLLQRILQNAFGAFEATSSNTPQSSNNVKREEEDDDDENAPDIKNLLDTRNDNEILYGKTEKYEWNQTETEVEMFLFLDSVEGNEDIRAKNMTVDIKKDSLKVSAYGKELINGIFFAKVLADDCTWQLDRSSDNRKVVWITLYKASPTLRNQHWRSIIKGDPEIKVSHLGPPVHGIDVDSKSSIKNAAKMVSSIAFYCCLPLLTTFFFLLYSLRSMVKSNNWTAYLSKLRMYCVKSGCFLQ